MIDHHLPNLLENMGDSTQEAESILTNLHELIDPATSIACSNSSDKDSDDTLGVTARPSSTQIEVTPRKRMRHAQPSSASASEHEAEKLSLSLSPIAREDSNPLWQEHMRSTPSVDGESFLGNSASQIALTQESPASQTSSASFSGTPGRPCMYVCMYVCIDRVDLWIISW